MKLILSLIFVALTGAPALAQDLTGSDFDRDPASVLQPEKKRAFPGGTDEEDLRVQAALPEAALKIDSRSIQREIFKELYNQELKEDRPEDAED